MSNPIPRVEIGTTKLCTVVYSSVPPNSAALFTVHAGSGAATLVYSVGGVSSDAGFTWGAFFTVPASSQVCYAWTWTASFGAGPVIVRGQLQGIATRPL